MFMLWLLAWCFVGKDVPMLFLPALKILFLLLSCLAQPHNEGFYLVLLCLALPALVVISWRPALF